MKGLHSILQQGQCPVCDLKMGQIQYEKQKHSHAKTQSHRTLEQTAAAMLLQFREKNSCQGAAMLQRAIEDKQRATPCKECLQRKETPKIKSGFCCVQSNERVRINAPVIRSERSVIIVSQHQLQWPPDDPKARNHAQHFDNVILGATRKSAVVSEFWCEFEVL